MNIWLINPFSDLPHESASEGRFCCLARTLVAQGHQVTWWSVDFHHRTKSRRSLGGRWETGDGRWGASETKPATGEPKTGNLELVLIPVPEYRKNISFARLRSHRAYGSGFAKAAAERIAHDPDAVPDVIHLSAPPLDCIAPALDLKERYGCRVTVDVMDLWPETFTRLVPGGKWEMEDGRWEMGDGRWEMGDGRWEMGDGRWKFAFRRWLLHRLFGSLYQKARRGYCEADGVCAVSQEYLDLVAAIRSNPTAQPLNPHDLYLCYVGGKLIEACDPPASDLQRSSSKKTVTFIYVGAMTPTYDLATVLEAAKVLKLEGWAFDLVFAGSGVSEPILQERVVQMGLQKEVRFLGFLDQANLESALRSADVGLNAIMPGTFITMPHKLSDYLCAGLAVINSITGEAEDLLSEFDAGVFYEAENVDSLAECMRDYIRDADRLASQKSAAYRLAQEKFDRRKTYTELAHWILKM